MGNKSDPVLADQGGRLMPVNPLHPVSITREESVRRRAYQIYEERGRQRGHELDDWLAAEREMAIVQD